MGGKNDESAKKINERKRLNKVRRQQFKACVVAGLCKLSCFNLSRLLRFIRCPSLCSQCTQCVYYAAGEQMVTEYFNQILTKLKSVRAEWESKVNTRKEGLTCLSSPLTLGLLHEQAELALLQLRPQNDGAPHPHRCIPPGTARNDAQGWKGFCSEGALAGCSPHPITPLPNSTAADRPQDLIPLSRTIIPSSRSRLAMGDRGKRRRRFPFPEGVISERFFYYQVYRSPIFLN